MAPPAFNRRQAAALALTAPLGLLGAWPATAQSTTEPDTAVDLAPDPYLHLTAQVMVNGQGPFTFLVDTGANRSAISEAVAERLNLPPGPPIRVHSVIGSRDRPSVRIAELRIGDRVQRDVWTPTLAFTGVAADGVLGVDWLKNRRLTFHFEENRLEIASSLVETAFDAQALGGRTMILPARLRSGQLSMIDAFIGRHNVAAMIDTGAQFTLGNNALRALVEPMLGADYTPQRLGILTVTGERIEGDLLRIPTLRLGALAFRGLPVVFADLRIFSLWGLERAPALVLGLQLVSQFRTVSLDFGRRQVRFDSASRGRPTRQVQRSPSAAPGRGSL